MAQAGLAFGPADMFVAQHLIDQIDEAGYLTASLLDIANRLGVPLARVEAVLRRLAAADTAPSARFTMAVTPTTMPNATVAVFGLLAAALVISRRRNRAPIAVAASNSSSAAILGVTLLVQPLLMLTAGFIIASTITFVVTANTWRGVLPALATLARDAAIGVTFAAIIYLVFTSGLGVVLP